MRILIDIGHPAHVHLFKNFTWEMQKKGHHIFFTCRDKEYESYLLKHYGFQFKSFGRKYTSKVGKMFGLFEFDLKELFSSIKFKPDILLSHGSMYAAHAAFLLQRPHISLEDSGNMEQIRLYRPFTKAILTPDVLFEDLGRKQIKYKSFHELAYLHPKYFKQDDTIFKFLNISLNDKYCILRFVSWAATHDSGQKGFSKKEKRILVKLLSKKMKVFISSESELTDDLKPFQINIPPEKIHDALYFASLVISEGATIASEAGVLGTTSLYFSSIRRSYCEDQERLNLVLNYQNGEAALDKVKEIICDESRLRKQSENRNILFKEKIDVTALLVWFIENWPDSYTIMKENPGYQGRFK